MSEVRSEVPCLFCGHRVLTLSDRYSWGTETRSQLKAMMKKTAYRDEANQFPEIFGESGLILWNALTMAIERHEHKDDCPDDCPDPDEVTYEYALANMRYMEAVIIRHAEANRDEEEPEKQTHCVRICALCWDRAMVAKNGLAVFRLFR
jgi:hypothetical protein